ncbi:hypothetical protein OJAV_G00193300 [Oryzias javanicus]|uniref:G-protein coupled receptors family 3 profile domain-containing protein n=1 Tax=Oryzias javanicus TaxID=123683 RepID=A0A3S2PSK1_ORYJA|nr:hypothetical protein OJAV_G00193300 [Oryzias javanicus]
MKALIIIILIIIMLHHPGCEGTSSKVERGLACLENRRGGEACGDPGAVRVHPRMAEGSTGSNSTPRGCGPNVDSLYYNLCDLSAAWGIVLEALAAAGIIFSFVLFISLLASMPFIRSSRQRSSVPLHTGFLVCTAGLFCLTFAFIVGKDFATCTSRRFLFGVLFGGCFACLLMQCVRLNILSRRNSGPRAWGLCLGALGLWLVEVVINTEWLIITVVRHPVLTAAGGTDSAAATPCNIANQDFVMALIYVMILILAVVVASLSIMGGKHATWKKEGALVLAASLLSVGIWLAWIVMYVYGNKTTGGPTWDDPTLAIALVSNAWVFIVVYTIPQICCLSSDDEIQQDHEDPHSSDRVGYETILKEQKKNTHNMFVENKAFSMDEPSRGPKFVSPYSGYTGQVRTSVYQPTELALMTKAVGSQAPDQTPEMIIPRATVGSAVNSRGSTPPAHTHASGPGLQRTAQWPAEQLALGWSLASEQRLYRRHLLLRVHSELYCRWMRGGELMLGKL